MAHIPHDARWYLADVVLELTVGGDARNVVHVNLHLIEARSPEQAYEKAVALGRNCERCYPNPAGQEVRVVFRGLRGLNVIHDALEDGVELTYEEQVSVPEAELVTWVPPKARLTVFRDREDKRDFPNYMPESIARKLRDEGIP